MTKQTLKITTRHGEFTRTTNTPYTHVVVRSSPRAMAAHQAAQATVEGARRADCGVYQRWNKDRGFAVAWHGSERAAHNAAAAPYGYDSKAVVIGIYPVNTN